MSKQSHPKSRPGVDFIGTTALFVIHDGQGRVMLHKRSQKARDENGRWDFGGGAIELDESIEEAVRRELKEEFDAQALDLEFLTVYDAFREQDGTMTHWIAIAYAVKINPQEVKINEPDKIDEIGWFTESNLPSPLHSQFWKSYQVALDKKIVR